MIFKTGNLFDSDAPALGHGVNCAGVMGAGIAKTFKELYPHNYENYRAACQAGQLHPGQVHVNFEKGVHIINMASQNMPGADASYEWLFESTLRAARGASKKGLDRIAIPMIGCGIGGLDHNKVITILKAVEHIVDYDIDFELWRQ